MRRLVIVVLAAGCLSGGGTVDLCALEYEEWLDASDCRRSYSAVSCIYGYVELIESCEEVWQEGDP